MDDSLRDEVRPKARRWALCAPIRSIVRSLQSEPIRPIAGAVLACAWLAGCPAPRTPEQPVPELAIEIGRTGGSLRGVAGDATTTYAAVTTGEGTALSTAIEARRGGSTRLAWATVAAGGGGPLVRTGDLVVAAVSASAAEDRELRGSPAAVVVGLDAATGQPRWRIPIDSSEWSVISAAAPVPDGGVLVGGSFSGTLRAGAKVVSSGGKTDGFVARLSGAGDVVWLVRMGGPGADAIQGVAATGDRIAIAGTFAAGADLLGTALEASDPKSLNGDGFVAELDPVTARPRWAAVFGGKLDDAVAGVAIDGRGRVVVAAQARDVMHVNGRDLVAQGPADALVAWWERDGGAGPAILVGGAGFDGAAGITAAGDRVIVGCFFAGALQAGARTLTAAGGDDAVLVALDGGAVVDAWPASGDGREEIAAISSVPGGFVAGIAHTAGARFARTTLPSPADPASGAAIVVRAAR